MSVSYIVEISVQFKFYPWHFRSLFASFDPVFNHLSQWRQFTNFLGGQNFYGVGEIFCCILMPKAPYQHPLLKMKSIHVLKFTKAWYACTHIEHWIYESQKKNLGILGGGDGPPAPPIGATELS